MRLMSRLESTDEEYQERVDKFSEYRKKNNNLISISDKEKSRNIDLSAVPVFTNKGAWFTSQYYYLLRRSWSQYVRDPGTTKARYGDRSTLLYFWKLIFKIPQQTRLGQNLIVSIFSGLLFLQLGHSESNITNRAGAIFVMLMFSVFATGNSVLHLCKPFLAKNILAKVSNPFLFSPPGETQLFARICKWDVQCVLVLSCQDNRRSSLQHLLPHPVLHHRLLDDRSACGCQRLLHLHGLYYHGTYSLKK